MQLKPRTRSALEKMGVLSDPNETPEDRRWSNAITGGSVVLALFVTSLMDLGLVRNMMVAVVIVVLVGGIGTALRLEMRRRKRS